MRLVPALLVLLVLCVPAASAESLRIAFHHPAGTAEPQTMVPHPFDITNLQDRPVRVTFRVDSDAGGRWTLLAPAPVTLDAGETKTVVAEVATDFHNGYVKGKATWMLTATPYTPGTMDPAGEPARLEIGQSVKGWYVPAPGLGPLRLPCSASPSSCVAASARRPSGPAGASRCRPCARRSWARWAGGVCAPTRAQACAPSRPSP